MEIIKDGSNNYKTLIYTVTCPVCGCIQKGTIDNGDFEILAEYPYHFKYNCAYCSTQIKA